VRSRKKLRLAALAVLATTAALVAVTVPAASADVARMPRLAWDVSSLHEAYVPPAGEYSYAPSVIDIGTTRWVWTCHNAESRVIRDHIYLEKFVNGRLVKDESVLAATAGAWDSFHTCDPSVVAGKFAYNGARYGWAMFYLGNDLDASAHNQIGVAFATSPDGPWIKDPNPIVTFADPQQWGAGQPSAVSVGSAPGRVLLFYTQGDTSTRAFWRSVDLGSMRGPAIGEPHLVPISGLTGTDGSADYLNNYDVALDAAHQRFVAVREQHPYPVDNPWWIGQSVAVDVISATDLLDGSGSWHPLNTVTPALTGLARNHNAGLVRTAGGSLPSPDSVTVEFTSSCGGPTCDSLFNYDLWTITGRLRH
jgi:hypothetical protein